MSVRGIGRDESLDSRSQIGPRPGGDTGRLLAWISTRSKRHTRGVDFCFSSFAKSKLPGVSSNACFLSLALRSRPFERARSFEVRRSIRVAQLFVRFTASPAQKHLPVAHTLTGQVLPTDPKDHAAGSKVRKRHLFFRSDKTRRFSSVCPMLVSVCVCVCVYA